MNAETVSACECALNDYKLRLVTMYYDQAESYVEALPMTEEQSLHLRFLVSRHHQAKAQLWALTHG